jgi:hypothetical protein
MDSLQDQSIDDSHGIISDATAALLLRKWFCKLSTNEETQAELKAIAPQS